MRLLLIGALAMALVFPGCFGSDTLDEEDIPGSETDTGDGDDTQETQIEEKDLAEDPDPVVGSCTETVTRAGFLMFVAPETGADEVDDMTMFLCPFTAADSEGVHAYQHAVVVAEWDPGMDTFASNGWLRVHSNTCYYGPEDAPGMILSSFDPPCSVSENEPSSSSDLQSPLAIPVDGAALEKHADDDLRAVLHLDGIYENTNVEIRIILFDEEVQMNAAAIAQKW